jgi:hypothetical protein
LVPDVRGAWRVQWPDGELTAVMPYRLARDTALQRATPVRQVGVGCIPDAAANAQAVVSVRPPA